jgi:hypothetical protein
LKPFSPGVDSSPPKAPATAHRQPSPRASQIAIDVDALQHETPLRPDALFTDKPIEVTNGCS